MTVESKTGRYSNKAWTSIGNIFPYLLLTLKRSFDISTLNKMIFKTANSYGVFIQKHPLKVCYKNPAIKN